MVDVKQSVQAEVNRVKVMSADAARSGAYLYPLKVCPPTFCSESAVNAINLVAQLYLN